MTHTASSVSTRFRTPSALRLFTCGALAFGVLAHSTLAQAFCRTTTCNANLEECGEDEAGCMVAGAPLFWPDLCVTFGVHADGSVLRNIKYERAQEVAIKAFREWISADCGGGAHPFIGVADKGKVFCDQLEYNHGGKPTAEDPNPNAQGPNANIIMFRDAAWPYSDQDKTIALTTITFIKRTGEILDADIEVNSFGIELSTGDTRVTSDLQSILTHEVGHFFGLAHTKAKDATMNKNYDRTEIDFRDLAPDDVDGICSIYPPQPGYEIADCAGEEPRYGFSRFCGTTDEAEGGCSVAAAGAPTHPDESGRSGWSSAWLLGGGLAAVAALRARRRRTR